jgi:hypothetical protein
LTTGKVSEPEERIGNRRLFSTDDVLRLAHHFKVTPNWAAIEPTSVEAKAREPMRLMLRPPFEVMSAGECCCEIKDGDGEVFAWASDRGRALVLAGLLEAAAGN